MARKKQQTGAKRPRLQAGELRLMTPDQLQDEIVKRKKEQFNLRFQAATGQLEQTDLVSKVRREIAVLKTVLGEKSRALAAQTEKGA